MRITLRTRLLLALGTMLVLTLVVGGIGIVEAGRINERIGVLYDDDLVGTGQIAALAQEVQRVRATVLAHILTTDPARRADLEAAIARRDQAIDTTVEAIRAGDSDGQQRDALAQFTQNWAVYKRARDGVTLPASRTGNSAAALSAYTGDEGTRFDTLNGTVDALLASKAAAARATDDELNARYEVARRLIVGATLLAFAVGLGLLLGLRRTFGHMTGALRSGSQDLAASSGEILAAASQQAAGATEQSAAIAETTATVDEVRVSAEQAVALAEHVTATAQQARQVAEGGVAAVQHAMTGMADIGERVQSIAENILALSEQRQQIGEIIAAVNDLADQSNLLALNAAIEASRAGEHGKGFAVVAQEIRTLAEGSKAATAQVRTILADIQRATNAAVMATEQGTKGVDSGVRTIEQAGQTIDDLAEAIRQAAGSAAQIAASVRQHAVGMEQIAVAMGDINGATAQSLAAVRNTQEASEGLADLAGRLKGVIGQYRM